MAHRYKVREIAQQAGLSEATVDRVLHQRPGVRENTVAEVNQAIADLDKQRAQLRLNGRRYLIDVVMQTPQRFSDAFRAAVEAELPCPFQDAGRQIEILDSELHPMPLSMKARYVRWWPTAHPLLQLYWIPIPLLLMAGWLVLPDD